MENRPTIELLEKIRSGYCLPALSAIALQLIEMASKETSSVNDLAELIEKDPSLTVRVLGLANSALLRNGTQITTLGDAVRKIGIDRLRIMTLSLSLRDVYPMGKRGPLDYEAFWRSSLYRALIAKSLARELRTCKPDEAFIAGLTLEIGLLVFYDLLLKGKSDVPTLSLYPMEGLLDWERQTFGLTHRQAGAEALRYWRFPDAFIECQAVYPGAPNKENISPLAFTCSVAGKFASLISEKSAGWHVTFVETELSFGIGSATLADILAAAFDEVESTALSLNLEMSKEKDILGLMAKARDILNKLTDTAASWAHFAFDSRRHAGPSVPQKETGYPLQERLRIVAKEIGAPLKTIVDFAAKLNARLDPGSIEGAQARVIMEEAKKVELALSMLL